MSASNMSQDYIESAAVDTQSRPNPLLASTTTFGDSRADANSMSHEEAEKLPLGKAVKRYPKVTGYSLALASTYLGVGYDLSVVGAIPAIDSFLEDFGYRYDGRLIVPSVWYSLWLALPPAGMAVGSLTGGELQDRIGRKFTLMIGGISSALSVAIIFFAYLMTSDNSRRAMFAAGLTLQGYSVGIIKNTVLTYISENVPTAIRGSAMALLPTCNLLGQLIGALVLFGINDLEGNRGYLAVFGSQWFFSLVAIVVSVIMPDSPAYYLKRGKNDEAIRAATRLFAPRVDPGLELEKIDETLKEEQATMKNSSYLACFRGTHLRRTLIVIFASIIPPLWGLDLLSNASTFLKVIGMPSGHALLFLILGIVIGILGNGTGIWLLTRVGRRPATITTYVGASAFWLGLGITSFFNASYVPYISAATMIAVVATCGLGCWPASYAIMGETSSLQLRPRTQAIGVIAAQVSTVVMSIILPYLFQPDAAALGAKTGFIYTGLCLTGAGLAFFFLPEMKGRTALEIDMMFEERVPTRKFKTWGMPSQVSVGKV